LFGELDFTVRGHYIPAMAKQEKIAPFFTLHPSPFHMAVHKAAASKENGYI